MKEYKIDNAIEGVNRERKEELRVQLRLDLDLSQTEEPQVKSRRFINVKTFALGFAGICAVCLAIVLPISLRTVPQEQSPERFSSTTQLTYSDLGCTLKEYGEQTGKNLLYVDWYDVAGELVTEKYYLPENKDRTIYLSEYIYNEETGDQLLFRITDMYTHVDYLDAFRNVCLNDYEYNNVKMKLGADSGETRAFFEYDGYNYYVSLQYPTSADDIFYVIEKIF